MTWCGDGDTPRSVSANPILPIVIEIILAREPLLTNGVKVILSIVSTTECQEKLFLKSFFIFLLKPLTGHENFELCNCPNSDGIARPHFEKCTSLAWPSSLLPALSGLTTSLSQIQSLILYGYGTRQQDLYGMTPCQLAMAVLVAWSRVQLLPTSST